MNQTNPLLQLRKRKVTHNPQSIQVQARSRDTKDDPAHGPPQTESYYFLMLRTRIKASAIVFIVVMKQQCLAEQKWSEHAH